MHACFECWPFSRSGIRNCQEQMIISDFIQPTQGQEMNEIPQCILSCHKIQWTGFVHVPLNRFKDPVRGRTRESFWKAAGIQNLHWLGCQDSVSKHHLHQYVTEVRFWLMLRNVDFFWFLSVKCIICISTQMFSFFKDKIQPECTFTRHSHRSGTVCFGQRSAAQRGTGDKVHVWVSW